MSDSDSDSLPSVSTLIGQSPAMGKPIEIQGRATVRMQENSDTNGNHDDIKAGEFWIYTEGERQWPVITCNVNFVRQHYQTWSLETARSPGMFFNPPTSPETVFTTSAGCACLHLGSLKGSFIPVRRLTKFTPGAAADMEKIEPDDLVAGAWKDALSQFEANDDGRPDMSFWKDRLMNQKKSKKALKRSSRTRSTYEDFAGPGVDDEEEDAFLDSNKGNDPRIKSEPDTTIDSPRRFVHFRPELPNKRARTTDRSDPGVKFERQRDESDPRIASNLDHIRQSQKLEGEKDYSLKVDPNKVTIFISEKHVRFQITREKVHLSPYLSRIMRDDPEDGWYVMSPLLCKINANDFVPIGDFLETDGYEPKLLGDLTDYAHIEHELTYAERGNEITRCGRIYNVAKALEMEALQGLAFRKLKVLMMSGDHYPSSAVVSLIKDVYEGARLDLKQYLTEFIADNFWPLVVKNLTTMAEVMQKDDLAKPVFSLMGRSKVGDGKEEILPSKCNTQDQQPSGTQVCSKDGTIDTNEDVQTSMRCTNDRTKTDDEDLQVALAESKNEKYLGEMDEDLQAALERSISDQYGGLQG